MKTFPATAAPPGGGMATIRNGPSFPSPSPTRGIAADWPRSCIRFSGTKAGVAACGSSPGNAARTTWPWFAGGRRWEARCGKNRVTSISSSPLRIPPSSSNASPSRCARPTASSRRRRGCGNGMGWDGDSRVVRGFSPRRFSFGLKPRTTLRVSGRHASLPPHSIIRYCDIAVATSMPPRRRVLPSNKAVGSIPSLPSQSSSLIWPLWP
jgi:hypothetical protein